MNKIWKVEYDNDTGANDDSLFQWWTVSNGEKTFTVHSEDDAYFLSELLNRVHTDENRTIPQESK